MSKKQTLAVIADLFFTFTTVKMKGPNKTLKLNTII